MAKAKMSRSQRIRNMLKDGVSPKEIAQACNVKPQVVYNIRYMMNKKGGIATLPKPKLTKDGIATVPRKRGRPRKETLIVGPALHTEKPGAFVESKPVETSGTVVHILVTIAAFVVGFSFAMAICTA